MEELGALGDRTILTLFCIGQDGELVTGPGVRHLLGATGDCSLPLHLHKLTEQKEWEKVFIQATKANRELKPDTELLFCE